MSDTVSDDTEPTTEEPTPEQRRALFHVVRGEPDDAEVAALTAVLAVAASAQSPTTGDEGGSGVWVDRTATLRRPMHPGPGAWRTSTWPR